MKNFFLFYLLLVFLSMPILGICMDTAHEENICSELGFTIKTESHANCVLKLIARKNGPSVISADSDRSSIRLRNDAQEEAARALEETRRIRAEIERDRIYQEQRRIQQNEIDAQRRRDHSLIELNNRNIRDNERAMCESWGNRYCY